LNELSTFVSVDELEDVLAPLADGFAAVPEGLVGLAGLAGAAVAAGAAGAAGGAAFDRPELPAELCPGV
jgi:hypothetical protein